MDIQFFKIEVDFVTRECFTEDWKNALAYARQRCEDVIGKYNNDLANIPSDTDAYQCSQIVDKKVKAQDYLDILNGTYIYAYAGIYYLAIRAYSKRTAKDVASALELMTGNPHHVPVNYIKVTNASVVPYDILADVVKTFKD